MNRTVSKWVIRCAVATSLVISWRASGAVTVNGVVVSDQGQPVPNVVVSITPSTLADVVSSVIVYKAVTDQNGAFTVTITDPGTYAACAGSSAAALLDSCLWPNNAATLSIPASGTLATMQFKLTLQTGTQIQFRINDANHLLLRPGDPPPQNLQASTFLGVGVWTSDGHYYHAQLTSYDTNGFNYTLIVPVATNLLISFQSVNISVLDNTGAVVSATSPGISFQSTTSAAAVRTFSVISPNSATPPSSVTPSN